MISLPSVAVNLRLTNADRAQAAVTARIERGARAPEGKLPFTPRAIAVFSAALTTALETGHNYIGTEHLLLGIVRGDGVAAEVLAAAGLTQEALIPKVTTKLAGYARPVVAAKRSVTRTSAKPSPAGKAASVKKKAR
jgi:ATP-dependent Clp protease ATP-binding subunit ClpA